MSVISLLLKYEKFIMERENNKILDDGKRSLEIEIETLQNIRNILDQSFVGVVRKLVKCKGRVVVSGIGKSAIVAQKMAASFNSTGTPSLFLHAADAIHGDLGMIEEKDIVLLISKSGNTPEMKVITRLIKEFGNYTIALHSNQESYLAKQADLNIYIPVQLEAEPNNLAPTASTLAQLAIGDAITAALINAKGFTKDHFARYHPGGSLGKELFLKVKDLVDPQKKPMVTPSSTISEVIIEISSKRLGATAVVDGDTIHGIITDGDLRRMLQTGKSSEDISAAEIMSKNPKSIDAEDLAINGLSLMRQNNISQLIVLDGQSYLGIVHIHDLIKEGIN